MALRAVEWLPLALPLVLVCLMAIFFRAQARLAFLVFGGMTLVASSDKFDASKALYLAGIALIFAIAVPNLRNADARYSRLVTITALLLMQAAISFCVAVAHGNSMLNWLRDVSAFLIFAAAPVFAIDLVTDDSKTWILPMFVAAGAVSSVLYTIGLLGRRHLATATSNQHFFFSLFLPAALLSYASVASLRSQKNKVAWTALTIGIVLCMLSSGTRVAILLVVIPFSIVVFSEGLGFRSLLRVTFFLGTTLSAGLILFFYLMPLSSDSRRIVLQRFGAMVLNSGELRSDESVAARASETLVLFRAFVEDPVFGTGPGKIFAWPTFEGGHMSEGFNVTDSPLVYPAKYGLVGVTMLLVVVVIFRRFLHAMRDIAEQDEPLLALVAYSVFSLVYMVVGPFYEDKGFAMGLLFLLSLSLFSVPALELNPPLVESAEVDLGRSAALEQRT